MHFIQGYIGYSTPDTLSQLIFLSYSKGFWGKGAFLNRQDKEMIKPSNLLHYNEESIAAGGPTSHF